MTDVADLTSLKCAAEAIERALLRRIGTPVTRFGRPDLEDLHAELYHLGLRDFQLTWDSGTKNLAVGDLSETRKAYVELRT